MNKIVRWGSITLLLIFVLITQGRTVQAGLLKNLAVLQILLPWQEQQAQFFDPPCKRVGDFKPAIESLNAVLAVSPDDPTALTHLGRFSWLAGECDVAVELWETAAREYTEAAFELFRIGKVNKIPSSVKVLLADFASAQGDKYRWKGDNSAAYLWYLRSFDILPHHNTAIHVVEHHRQAGDTAAVERIWRGMVETLKVSDPEYWWARAELFALRKQWSLVALAYQRGAELSSDPYDFWMDAGDAWEKARNWDQAMYAYEKAVDARPDMSSPYRRLGRVCYAQENYREALKWFLGARDLTQDTYSLDLSIGKSYYFLVDYEHAQQYFEAALATNPQDAESWYYLAGIERAKGNLENAEECLISAIDNQDQTQTVIAWWIQLGDWRLEDKDCLGAREAYSKAQASGARNRAIQEKMDTFIQICGD